MDKDNWIQTYTGKKVYPFGDFTAKDVDIIDIAHALSLTCRWGGHCHYFYSVAEHSVYVSNSVSQNIVLEALMHDAAEAYLGDIPTPLKELLPVFEEAEKVVMNAIRERFDLSDGFEKEIYIADKTVQITEVEQLMPDYYMFMQSKWAKDCEGLPAYGMLDCLSPRVAGRLFLTRFHRYMKARDHQDLLIPSNHQEGSVSSDCS